MAGYPRKLLSLELALKNIIKELKKDEKYVIDILKNGSNRAKEIAKININKVKDIVGFISH